MSQEKWSSSGGSSTSTAPLNDRLRLVADFWEPEADFCPVRKFPEARPCHGVEEIARFLTAYRDAWERYEMEIKKLIPALLERAAQPVRRLGQGGPGNIDPRGGEVARHRAHALAGIVRAGTAPRARFCSGVSVASTCCKPRVLRAYELGGAAPDHGEYA
jgi:hypothetical protein